LGSPKQTNTSQDVLHTSDPEYSLRKSPKSDELRRMMCAILSYETYLVLLTRGNPGATTPLSAAKPLNC